MAEEWSPETLKKNLDNSKKVFLKVWQKGCGPCKMSEPAVERMEAANKHGLIFAKICVDDYPEIAQIADIEAMPAFFVFSDMKMRGKFFGFKGIAKLEAMLEEALST